MKTVLQLYRIFELGNRHASRQQTTINTFNTSPSFSAILNRVAQMDAARVQQPMTDNDLRPCQTHQPAAFISGGSSLDDNPIELGQQQQNGTTPAGTFASVQQRYTMMQHIVMNNNMTPYNSRGSGPDGGVNGLTNLRSRLSHAPDAVACDYVQEISSSDMSNLLLGETILSNHVGHNGTSFQTLPITHSIRLLPD